MTDRLPIALLGSAEWLNSKPLGRAELSGRPTIVNFWTSTCINWLRQAPYVRAWWRAYRTDGLVVIGVHTPEFSFEQDTDLVRQTTKDHEIDYPIVVDNDYAIWSALDNHYWPALYFVDENGIIRDYHVGEGQYAESERSIQRLLDVTREPVSVNATGVEAAADWDNLRTLETYLGYGRSAQFVSPGGTTRNQRHTYRFPSYLHFNHWALDGDWTVRHENIELEKADGSIACRFQARDAHLVLAPAADRPVPFQIFLDGKPPAAAHGLDVDEDGHGIVRDGRLYQLVRQPGTVEEQTLEITFLGPGVQAYAFTFG